MRLFINSPLRTLRKFFSSLLIIAFWIVRIFGSTGPSAWAESGAGEALQGTVSDGPYKIYSADSDAADAPAAASAPDMIPDYMDSMNPQALSALPEPPDSTPYRPTDYNGPLHCSDWTFIANSATRSCGAVEVLSSGATHTVQFNETHIKHASGWELGLVEGGITFSQKITSSSVYTDQYEKKIESRYRIEENAGFWDPVLEKLEIWENGRNTSRSGTSIYSDTRDIHLTLVSTEENKEYYQGPGQLEDVTAEEWLSDGAGQVQGTYRLTQSVNEIFPDNLIMPRPVTFFSEEYHLPALGTGKYTRTQINHTYASVNGKYYPSNTMHTVTTKNLTAREQVVGTINNAPLIRTVYSWDADDTYKTVINRIMKPSGQIFTADEEVRHTSISRGSTYYRKSIYDADGRITSLNGSFICLSCAIQSRTISATWGWRSPGGGILPGPGTWGLTGGSLEWLSFFQGYETANSMYIPPTNLGMIGP